METVTQPHLDILCRVVDNFGDIGVAYRLARAFAALRPDLGIRLITDDLLTFNRIAPFVDPVRDVQKIGNLTVIRWDHPWDGLRNPAARAVIETFGCGFPEHYEEILFDVARTDQRRVVDLEYLTAESWAEEYHLLPSPARTPKVEKFFFMPGFTSGTGGLIFGRNPVRPAANILNQETVATDRKRFISRSGLNELSGHETGFWTFIFSYEYDFKPAVAGIAGSNRNPVVLLSRGRGAESFISAWTHAGKPFPVIRLPFLPQEQFHEALRLSDFLVVRGEDSLSLACLSGIPFLWQAYPIDSGEHTVKVEAFLGLLAHHFEDVEAFGMIQSLIRQLNGIEAANPEKQTALIRSALEKHEKLMPGFKNLVKAVQSNGDLASRLLYFFSGLL